MFKPQSTTTIRRIRPPAVAGMFYPADPRTLQRQVEEFLREAKVSGPVPKALIAPHAGYVYSGPIAASGYKLLQPAARKYRRVVLFGPSHHVAFPGLATSSADGFATPLGVIPTNREMIQKAVTWPQVEILDQAHHREHSLEVHLPFLQMTLDDFTIVPFVIGQASPQDVAEVIDGLWQDDETLVVVSSDLSHYHDYSTAQALDTATSRLIETFRWEQLSGDRACGYKGIQGLLKVAEDRNLTVKTVDLRNSGDTSGMIDQVVGYGSYVIY